MLPGAAVPAVGLRRCGAFTREAGAFTRVLRLTREAGVTREAGAFTAWRRYLRGNCGATCE